MLYSDDHEQSSKSAVSVKKVYDFFWQHQRLSYDEVMKSSEKSLEGRGEEEKEDKPDEEVESDDDEDDDDEGTPKSEGGQPRVPDLLCGMSSAAPLQPPYYINPIYQVQRRVCSHILKKHPYYICTRSSCGRLKTILKLAFRSRSKRILFQVCICWIASF